MISLIGYDRLLFLIFIKYEKVEVGIRDKDTIIVGHNLY